MYRVALVWYGTGVLEVVCVLAVVCCNVVSMRV
jgi:hypothetical protein